MLPQKLDEIGISKIQSSRSQRIAALPEEAIVEYVAKAKGCHDETLYSWQSERRAICWREWKERRWAGQIKNLPTR